MAKASAQRGKRGGRGPKATAPPARKPAPRKGLRPPLPESFHYPVRPKGRAKAWWTLFLVLAGACVPYLVPELSSLRVLSTQDLRTVFLAPWEGHPPARPYAFVDLEPLRPPPVTPAVALWVALRPPMPSELGQGVPASAQPPSDLPPGFAPVPGTIEDFGGAMGAFYAALGKTARREPGAVTRIAHYGDSPLTGDLISGEARSRLQARFGDAGHGFVLGGKPWAWYGHLGVLLGSSGWRVASPFLPSAPRGPCGFGLAGFLASEPAARCTVETSPKGFGRAASRFDVHYLAKPGGGTLLASLDGGPEQEIPTGGNLSEARVQILKTRDGPHRLSVRPKGDGEVALFGVALEREGPGLVYDALGANGASIHTLSRVPEDPWAQDLALRRPDLVILQYGTNESTYAATYADSYRRDYRDVLRRIRRAVPKASILIMAPMDRGQRDALGEIVTVPGIPRIVEAQRQVAREEGLAFFNTFEAMGGEGTMGRWYERERPLVSGDLTHPSRAGSDIVARLLVEALEEAFGASGGARTPPPAQKRAEPKPKAVPVPSGIPVRP